MIDARLLEMYPGRTLEELDAIDWGRLNRALEAKNIMYIEELRAQHMKGKVDDDAITPEEFAAFRDHLELIDKYGA